MVNFDGILYNLETEINKISADIKIDFGNKQLMTKQLKSLNIYQSQLEGLQSRISGIIRETESAKPDFPVLGTLAGGLLALFGGNSSALGGSLLAGTVGKYNQKKDDLITIRQKFLKLQEKNGSIIEYINNLIWVANRSLSNPKLMKDLTNKNSHKNTIISIFTAISYFFFISSIATTMLCLLLLLTGQIIIYLIGFTLAILAFLAFLLVYSVVEKANKSWQLLIAKILVSYS
ncbi:hypothetical protein [Nostoc sp.]|uniref:hypothetical protein n=1 Tax=Nostoc sp. TaxID=1180 RepID=UPI002FF5319D